MFRRGINFKEEIGEILALNETMEKVDEISETFDNDPGHNKQVTTLALSFFDSMTSLHHYGESERNILEIASRLHDIGWSRTVLKKHHKFSGKMILDLDIPGLDDRERVLTAMVARYHTKALPDINKHPKFASLKVKDRDIVEWLAAILRVADALDSSHTGVVKRVRVKTNENEMDIHIEASGDCWDEMRRVRRKQDLLAKKIGREIVYQC